MADENNQNSNQNSGNPVPTGGTPVKPAPANAGVPVGGGVKSAGTATGTATGTAAKPPASDGATVKKAEAKFDIPQQVKDKHGDLIKLVLETESMNDEERQYWFHILPIMTAEQVEKFRKILDNEKEQLAKLDQEYEKEIKQLNDKHLVEWKSFKTKEKREKRVAEETEHEASEKAQEDDLLNQIDSI